MRDTFSCRSTRHVPRGLSSVETLVVIVIATSLAAIAFPSFSQLIAQYRLNAGSNALMSAFIMARQSAIEKNQVIGICAGNTEAGCHSDWSRGEWIVFTDRDRNGKSDEVDDVIQSGSATPDHRIRILPNRPMKQPVLFQPIGHAEQASGAFAAGTLRLCIEASTVTQGVDLILSKSGHLRSQSLDDGSACLPP